MSSSFARNKSKESIVPILHCPVQNTLLYYYYRRRIWRPWDEATPHAQSASIIISNSLLVEPSVLTVHSFPKVWKLSFFLYHSHKLFPPSLPIMTCTACDHDEGSVVNCTSSHVLQVYTSMKKASFFCISTLEKLNVHSMWPWWRFFPCHCRSSHELLSMWPPHYKKLFKLLTTPDKRQKPPAVIIMELLHS